MFHSIDECTEFIFSLKASTYKGEPLEAVRILLENLGNPHEKVKFIHFAGSNGKGSTLNATREILMEQGIAVGAFISPHLERVNERITINKVQILDEQFLKYTNLVLNLIETKLDGKVPSFFEIMTILAFLHFANEKVDVALIETGIGGRIDSTNVITPEVSVITTISLEHTDLLGDTYEKIAFEKAGIIKENKPVVVGVKQAQALRVIREKADECNAKCYALGQEILISNVVHHTIPQTFDYVAFGHLTENVPVIMEGVHQMNNAALAITAAKLFLPDIDDQSICQGLLKAKWEGRFEHFGKQIIIDGAHNSEGTAALIETLKRNYPNHHYKFVYAALKDKDHQKSIQMMDQEALSMSFTEIPLPRAEKAEILASKSQHQNVRYEKDWRYLLEDEILQIKENELLVITGSLYFIADVRKFLLQRGGK
ncbi:dihydrofolate synthase/folylpolyglutamate synthase [Lysinibacillus composti]|uniref:tetrahydrofolate synthase n=1 Tax=Lysinibacillus composti TaxID=720633 RepID=A0A3N9UKG6_9BACI|nr:folylpolyglutamate synthase/dihydrofolate synthase family protein [Lysinibacillus composti]MBM7606938.1 dihydrofolate synthase/folylpolyglutamate synthase [Lysinibacillus composti]RQW76459.1 bifunctional folylpolyglutamate synthase/dihydrofolate synthase [Lysinibacillus composti]